MKQLRVDSLLKKNFYAALIMLVVVLFPALQLDAQEEVLNLIETETATQSRPSFRKISLKPEFPYSDGWLGGDGALSVQLSDTKVLSMCRECCQLMYLKKLSNSDVLRPLENML